MVLIQHIQEEINKYQFSEAEKELIISLCESSYKLGISQGQTMSREQILALQKQVPLRRKEKT